MMWKSDSLGWQGIQRTDPKVTALREVLSLHNGISSLPICDPDDFERISACFYRDGFVVVHSLIEGEALDRLQRDCDEVIWEIVSLDHQARGNRGSHRYSFGGASLTGAQLHHEGWLQLIDHGPLNAVVAALFQSEDYIVRSAGGDFCLPGAVDYQPLHSDMQDRTIHTAPDGTPFTHGAFFDPEGLINYRDLPCPFISCNILTCDITALNGATRQIPGTQRSQDAIPTLKNEPDWMRYSTVSPAPAGAVLIRDVRAWHGGTPNVSDHVRAIPNIEFYAPWFREYLRPSLRQSDFAQLSKAAQRRCRFIVERNDAALRIGYREDLGFSPNPFLAAGSDPEKSEQALT